MLLLEVSTAILIYKYKVGLYLLGDYTNVIIRKWYLAILDSTCFSPRSASSILKKMV